MNTNILHTRAICIYAIFARTHTKKIIIYVYLSADGTYHIQCLTWPYENRRTHTLQSLPEITDIYIYVYIYICICTRTCICIYLSTDGTYHIQYEDGDEEKNVARDLLEPLEEEEEEEEEGELDQVCACVCMCACVCKGVCVCVCLCVCEYFLPWLAGAVGRGGGGGGRRAWSGVGVCVCVRKYVCLCMCVWGYVGMCVCVCARKNIILFWIEWVPLTNIGTRRSSLTILTRFSSCLRTSWRLAMRLRRCQPTSNGTACVHPYIHIHVYVRIHAYIYKCMYIYVMTYGHYRYVCIYIYIYIYLHINTHTYTCIYKYMYI